MDLMPSGFLPRQTGDTQTFYCQNTVGALVWHEWRKPRGCTMVNLFCLGSGAGGAGGGAAISGTGAAGGAGGGTGAISRLLIPADFLPDLLYINVGVGGDGGTSNNSGLTGQLSFISTQMGSTVASNLVLVSGTAAPGAAAVGTTGGTAGTAFAGTGAAYSGMGVLQFIAGQAGAGGGANTGAAGSNITWGGSGITISGGAGGGGKGTTAGTDFAGGNITGGGSMPTRTGGSTTAALNGEDGLNYYRYPQVGLSTCGGAGGRAFGGTNATTGGNGGRAGFGCGGGGGGASTTGGVGGRGGDGLVIISAW